MAEHAPARCLGLYVVAMESIPESFPSDVVPKPTHVLGLEIIKLFGCVDGRSIEPLRHIPADSWNIFHRNREQRRRQVSRPPDRQSVAVPPCPALTFLTGNDFTNAAATTSDSTIFVNAGRDVVLSDTMETISASANALTLVAGRNFINNAGASGLTANNSRWLVYSANVNNSTNASILNWDFRRYGCSYSGGCTSGITVPATDNGLIYSARPTLSIGAVVEAKQVDGNANATLSNVVLNGVISGDNVTLGPITAKFADNSPGKHKPVYVTYSLTTGAELGYFLQNNGLYGEIYAPFIADSVRWFSQNAERYKRDVVEATARKSTATPSSPKLRDMLIIEPNLRSLLRIEDLF